MDLPTVKVERLYRQISNVLIQYIRDGHFAPGQLLPGERDLAKQLGVSRSSVREALIALEINGWVEIRTGHGVYVRPTPPDDGEAAATADTGTAEEEIGVEALMEAREAIEGEIAALAAKKATDVQIDAITRIVERMEADAAAGDMETFHEHDQQFHQMIGAMTGNPLFVDLTDMLWRKRKTLHYAKFERRYSDGSIIVSMCADHRVILEAIRGRNAAAARQAMRRHIRNAQKRLFGGRGK
ncbi:transcriptional regulator (plasmid) [Azospirillum sp. B510]|uniref:FadR/GntR family transcriptional regulator n=1 Tax=Azospirillum sp. (strain B510) TaxID=137722 RepID=UPI0001C4CF38|nr:FadR/GntR family transcriptional regulator [Azospirillum sp. B510]BAI76681.1 transcriptional regulator [Azospirillum sp. B510]